MAWLWLLLAPGFLLALACVPIGVAFELTSVPRWQGSVHVCWAGFVGARVRLGRDAARLRTARTPATNRPSSRGRHGLPRLSALVPALGHLAGLLRRLVAETHVRRFEVSARVGLDDPADTGVLYGALAPLFVDARLRRSCVFEPEFNRECLEVSASALLRLVPVRYLFVIGSFLVKPRTWRLAIELGR